MIKIIHFNFNNQYNRNIGDQAHVIAIQETLRELADEPVVFENKSIKLLSRQVIPNLWYYPCSNYYPTFLHNMYRSLIGQSYWKLVTECNDADLVLVGGGGVFMSQFLPFNNALIKKIKSPLVLFGVGYNQNLMSKDASQKQKDSVTALVSSSSLVAVRDDVTVDFLRGIGLNAALMCDPALFLSETDGELISVSGSSLKIGINLALHGWDGMEQLTDHLVEILSGLIKAKSAEGVLFYYFMHEPNEEHIIELFQANGVIFNGIIKTKDSRELKSAYRHVDLTISMMLHSTILAFGAGTPAIAIGYDKKNASFMKLSKQSDRYISAYDLTGVKLQSLFDTATNDVVKLKKEVLRTKRQLHKTYIGFAKNALDLAKQQK